MSIGIVYHWCWLSFTIVLLLILLRRLRHMRVSMLGRFIFSAEHVVSGTITLQFLKYVSYLLLLFILDAYKYRVHVASVLDQWLYFRGCSISLRSHEPNASYDGCNSSNWFRRWSVYVIFFLGFFLWESNPKCQSRNSCISFSLILLMIILRPLHFDLLLMRIKKISQTWFLILRGTKLSLLVLLSLFHTSIQRMMEPKASHRMLQVTFPF